jgi:4-amino-4-deoxy-L-arabinose transferase-like glycosyltransferase
MTITQIPKRPLSSTLTLVALWFLFYGSFTLFTPALLDDADSVHAEVARETLLRHDYVTLYANGIRYLEKAPLLYWSMAASMRVSQMLGHSSARALAVAARIPLALTVLALAFAVEAFARRAFSSSRAGLYAALILLSSFGIFLFTRITIPDAMVCLWLTLAMLAFWLTEQPPLDAVILSAAKDPCISPGAPQNRVPHVRRSFFASTMGLRLLCFAFATCCALNVLTKGLIGIVFPIAIVLVYLLLTRGPRGAITRIRQLHPLTSTAVFLAIAAPWHILIALANPTQGHPGSLTFTLHPAAGAHHWQVPLPTDGNVHGWAWFYFVNEQLLRYLNLRVPRDYDTVPLYLFWGLCLIWLMPWSAFAFKAISGARRSSSGLVAQGFSLGSPAEDEVEEEVASASGLSSSAAHLSGSVILTRFWVRISVVLARSNRESPFSGGKSPTHLLLILWAALPLLFFSFSTRQEYYVLPALPALVLLIARWLAQDTQADKIRRANLRCTAVLLALGTLFAAAALYFLLHTRPPAPSTDLAALLQQNPSDYAMSMGHFLDLNAQALGLFRLPLALAAASLFVGPLASYFLRRRAFFENSTKCAHAATLALAAGAFGFLLAAHLGLRTFAPVLSSAQLAQAIAPQVAPRPGEQPPLIVIHQEYEYGSTLGFYLQRPGYGFATLIARPGIPGVAPAPPTPAELAHAHFHPVAANPIHILTDANYNGTPNYGRSSNLWYGSFFPDAPPVFETQQSLAQKWSGPQRIFLWQDLANQPSPLPAALTPIYVIAKSGGKEIVSNQPNR